MYKRLQELGVPTSIVRDTDETLTRNERIKRMTDPFGNGTDVIIKVHLPLLYLIVYLDGYRWTKWLISIIIKLICKSV